MSILTALRLLFTRLKDSVHLAQVDETRARVLLAEGRVVDAEKVSRRAVRTLEKGDEHSLLAEALTTHGVALARLRHPETGALVAGAGDRRSRSKQAIFEAREWRR